MPRNILCDVDGCISRCDWRVRFAKDKQYDLFHSLSKYDDPIDFVVTELIYLHKNGFEIHLITGRTEKHRDITTAWLAKHGVPYNSLYMRGDNDFQKASEMKLDYILDTFNLHDIVCLIEDNGHTIRAAKEVGIETIHFCESSMRNVNRFRRFVDGLA